MDCDWQERGYECAVHIAYRPESAGESETTGNPQLASVRCRTSLRTASASSSADCLNAKKTAIKTPPRDRRISSTRTRSRRSNRTVPEEQMSRMPVASAELGCALMEASVTRDTEKEIVLLVVADPMLRAVLSQVLTKLGYRVLNA